MGFGISSAHIIQDLRQGVRALRKDASFSATVVLILALGIGATTTIFSVVKAVLLDPLPYADPERLVRLSESSVSRSLAQSPVSVPNFEDWRRRQSSFDQLAASEMATFTLTDSGDPERVAAARITANLVPALGVRPVEGRTFLPDEERPGSARVALLGYGLWQRRFGADPTIVNRTIQLNGESYTVVGIMPLAFDFPAARELWVPFVVDPVREPWRADRSNRNLAVFGRVKAGVSLATAAVEMDRIAGNLASAYPDTNSGWGTRVQSFSDWTVPRPVRQATLVVFGAVGLLLLLTCANVANLLLARAVGRQRELATHAALGATRARLAGRLLIESVVLGLCGGAVGALLAGWGVAVVGAVTIPEIPRLQHMAVDRVVLAFALAVSVLTGLLFGLFPAWWSSRPGLLERLRQGGTTTGSLRTQRLRGTLVAVQIGLTVALVVSGALLVRSFIELQRLPLGFVAGNVLTFQVNLPAAGYGSRERRVDFYDRWLTRVRAIPGVVNAGAATHAPYAPSEWKVDVAVPGAPSAGPTDAGPAAVARAVTPDYFRTMGIPVTRGRDFDARDADPATLELIVSEHFARRVWPRDDPLGKRFRPGASNPIGVVVGVVGDARHSAGDEPEPAFYFNYADIGMPSLAVAVRTTGAAERYATAIRHELRAIDRAQPIYNVRTIEQIVSRATAQPRLQALLVGMLGVAAVILAAFGTYSMIAFVVRQRRKEIAVRIALGASRSDISRVLLGESMRYAVPGIAAGLAASAAGTQLLKTLLFHVGPTDVLTFAVTPLAILGVASLATYWPARQAAAIRPVAALRHD